MTFWFEADVDDIDDVGDVVDRVTEMAGDDAADLPALAGEAGVVDDERAYYDALHRVTVALAERRIAEDTGTPERDLVHAVRALDALDEAAQTVTTAADDWRVEAGERGDGAVASLDQTVDGLADRREDVEELVRETARDLAPTLSAIAGPVLAARLVALAGGLADLARMPSGTVQVLGAEDALFRHLTDDTPPPKHGAIYLHPAVRGAPPEDRGRVARTLAGKLAIAARVDHYRGERDESVVEDWERQRDAIERSDGGGEAS